MMMFTGGTSSCENKYTLILLMHGFNELILEKDTSSKVARLSLILPQIN